MRMFYAEYHCSCSPLITVYLVRLWHLLPTTLFSGLDKMTEKAAPDEGHGDAPPPIPPMKDLATPSGTHSIQPLNEIQAPTELEQNKKAKSIVNSLYLESLRLYLGVVKTRNFVEL